jgi:class 3 adenylate cyclase/tetratricopeptide (TPR) repeat protein
MKAEPLSAPPPRAPEGERKQVTVLFADVKGSMGLAAQMDPEEWSALMERFFAILRQGIERFDGHIDKFTGDGIMALFGAPVAYEDHARRGCAAALYLRDELAGFGAEVERERGSSFAVRLGLNSGEVVAGPLGEDRKVEYTAVGNTVGLAQRMESLAEPGTAYVTSATASLVEGYFELRDLGPMQAKDADEAVAVFELAGSGAARTPLEVAAARGFSRFVGRDREMAALEAAFAQTCDGNGQVIGVVAGPGVGKSRLCHEFVETCWTRGVDVFAAHGLAHTQSVPFVPVLEILRTQFGITDQDDAVTTQTKISQAILGLDASLDDALPLLYDFLGVPDPDRPAPAIDPEARQRQIFGALNRLRRARSDRGPVVILVEDLHWFDSGSEAFVANLVNGVPDTRVLVVTTFRPEYHAPWAHRSHYGQLPLPPLGEEASQELLRDLLGPHPSLDGVAELVHARTGGNPFFIEEVVQGLVEEGSLIGRRGAYELAHTIEELKIPASVQAVLAARIDRLPEREKALVQAAAVIGRQFSGRVVGRVSGLAEEELEAALRTLVDAELVYETASYPEEEYTFKHALTEEVAYGSQLAKQKARTHTAVARALADLDPDKLDERASLIAHHYELGGELLEAAGWNARAAAWAGINNPVEAVRHWRRVRSLTEQLGTSPETAELAINARIQLLILYWRLGAASEEGKVAFEEEATDVFSELKTVADAADQPVVKALAHIAFGAVRQLSYEVEEGIELSVQGTRLADEIGDPALRSGARVAHSWGLFVLGRVREAKAMAEEMAEIIGEDRSVGRGMVVVSPYAWCRMQVAHFGTYCGRLDEGLAALGPVIELLGEEGDLETQSWAHRHCAIFADLAGADPDVAAAHANQSVEWADEGGVAWSRVFNREGLAYNHCHRGEWRQAIDVADEALTIQRNRRIALADVPLLLALRSRAQLGLGDLPGATSTAEEAIAVALRCGTKGYESLARLQLARALLADLHPGDERAARAELEHALSIVELLDIRVFTPQIHVELARLALAVGDEAGYGHQLETAHRLFLDVGAHGRAKEVASLVHP